MCGIIFYSMYICISVFYYLLVYIYNVLLLKKSVCENQKKGDFALFFCGSDEQHDIVQFIPVQQYYYSSTTMVVGAYSSVQSSPRTSPFVDGISMVEGVVPVYSCACILCTCMLYVHGTRSLKSLTIALHIDVEKVYRNERVIYMDTAL